jgi:4-hydroxy-tetrahydrodipicolinate reductase
MTEIVIQGIGGRMGHVLCDMIAQREDCCVVAGIDMKDGEQNGIPVYDSLEKLNGKGDVIIDFSSPAAVEKALPYCQTHKLPIVVCTTGLSEELQLKVVQLSRSVPVFKSANMSMGINVLAELCKRASAVLGINYDIEIVEQHHHNKLDAPSGCWPTPSTRKITARTIMCTTVPPCARSVTRRRSASALCAAAASWATTRCCSVARTR